MKFKTEQDAINWVRSNIGLAIKPKRKAKTEYVFAFSSLNAYDDVCEALGQELFKVINEKEEI